MAAKKSAASTAWKVIVGILVGLLILLLIAEFGLRWFMGNQMTKQFEEQGAKADVSFGASPLIFGMVRGTLPEMTMTTESTLSIDGAAITGQPASEVHVEDLTVGDEPIASHLTMSTTLPDEYLLATLQKGISDQVGNDKLGGLAVSNLVANQAESSVDVEFAGGLFSLTLRPEAKDGALAFTATNSKILAWDLPEDVTTMISEKLTEGMQQQLTTGDMRMESVTVGDGTVSIEMSGDNVNLNELGTQFGAAADTAAGSPASANA